MVFDGNDQTIGMRFNDVTIPFDATIVEAWIQFKVDETTSARLTVPDDQATLTAEEENWIDQASI